MPGFAHLIRTVPDFPTPGVQFRDIAPLLADGRGFAAAVAALAEPWRGAGLVAVAGIEARGFILGAAVARELAIGFVPLRKPGKLPGVLREVEYALEYGSDRLQVQADALPQAAPVLLLDDVLATGGTLDAAARLLETGLGARIAGATVLLEIAALGGRARWHRSAPLHAVLQV
ncbi:adenine phosphoribosyltransferase [Arenimonas composti]|uniref:Adenine phosphoribosyltransferase n=1 Tax=Arenimonas composti TR7-09 = DSM 18010 TaxID=1121013 RepID=A0A091C373_9GAMM|nr:adenine phosphoribosyltransferase [Arenimonas composti]KFN51090.1 hypothetical protein P873_04100 [Arenimonas composti TR7-09 = DSM 18010]